MQESYVGVGAMPTKNMPPQHVQEMGALKITLLQGFIVGMAMPALILLLSNLLVIRDGDLS